MTADPAFILAKLVIQRQVAIYGSIIEIDVKKGLVTLVEVRRARLRAESAVDQVTARYHEQLTTSEAGAMLLELLGKGEDDDDCNA
jgi:hypothetical protein